jgi:hypothetical protein
MDIDKIGMACVDDKEFTFSLTDDTRKSLVKIMESNRAKLPADRRAEIDRRIATIGNPALTTTKIPVPGMRMIGTFPSEKGASITSLLMDAGVAESAGLKKPLAFIKMNTRDATAFKSAVPKSVKQARNIDELRDAAMKEAGKNQLVKPRRSMSP